MLRQKNSVSSNAGKALCIVELWKIRDMLPGDAGAAGVRYLAGIKSFLLWNRRHFSRDFKFAPQRVSGAMQSIFEIIIPEDVKIISMPDIIPLKEIG